MKNSVLKFTKDWNKDVVLLYLQQLKLHWKTRIKFENGTEDALP